MNKELQHVADFYEVEAELKKLVKKEVISKDDRAQNLVAKAFQLGWEERERAFDAGAEESAHLTDEGWCCACLSDVAFMEGRIKDAKSLPVN